ncbi:MAG: GCN5-related N-acetyltransferase [Nocardioidaceae bacterium]|nr:GCN5-related N-acetyltransferase [Nocardioidaceae bacterium]
MPTLAVPDVRFHTSFLAAMAEFADEGRTGDGTMVGNDLEDYGHTWGTPSGFASYVGVLLRDVEVPRREGWVCCTSLWWVEGDEYLGRIAVRHTLDNEFLREVGGHIGYDVRRSARRRGHATAMLRAVLPVARDLGIEQALVSCDTDNVASRRAIEANGGVPDGERQGKYRFWVPTG